MFMASYTANYGLHQWEAADDFLRTDFNTDFGIIDGALGEKSEVIFGSYIGNGQTSQAVSLGFRPSAVLIEYSDGRRSSGNNYYYWGGLALDGGSSTVVSITGTGFTAHVLGTAAATNQLNATYSYMAFR